MILKVLCILYVILNNQAGIDNTLYDLPYSNAERKEIGVIIKELIENGTPKENIAHLNNLAVKMEIPYDKYKEILALILGAEKTGLPTRLLFDKINEGLAKRVELERLLKAAKVLMHRLIDAESIVETIHLPEGFDKDIKNKFIENIAFALNYGIEKEGIKNLTETIIKKGSEASFETLETTTLLLLELNNNGVPQNASLSFIKALIKKDYKNDDIRNITKTIIYEIKRSSELPGNIIYKARQNIELNKPPLERDIKIEKEKELGSDIGVKPSEKNELGFSPFKERKQEKDKRDNKSDKDTDIHNPDSYEDKEGNKIKAR